MDGDVITARRTAATSALAGSYLAREESKHLRGNRKSLLAAVHRDTGVETYTLHQLLRIAIDRADYLDLHLRGSQRTAGPHARWLLGGLVRIFGEQERPQLNL